MLPLFFVSFIKMDRQSLFGYERIGTYNPIDIIHMKLKAYVMDGHQIDIRPAPLERDWMDASHERFAYRCLPLNIANTHGWQILCSGGFFAEWKGGAELSAISIYNDPDTKDVAVSHFGQGVLTFHIPCLFRTEPGFDLMVQGPTNQPKDGIAPLSGVVETDWSPYTFTMNWKFTRPNLKVRFKKGEPICHIFPVRRADIEAVEPEMQLLSKAPEIKKQHDEWTASRKNFLTQLGHDGSQAQSDKWQKLYQQGVTPDGKPANTTEHRTRLRLKPFTNS